MTVHYPRPLERFDGVMFVPLCSDEPMTLTTVNKCSVNTDDVNCKQCNKLLLSMANSVLARRRTKRDPKHRKLKKIVKNQLAIDFFPTVVYSVRR